MESKLIDECRKAFGTADLYKVFGIPENQRNNKTYVAIAYNNYTAGKEGVELIIIKEAYKILNNSEKLAKYFSEVVKNLENSMEDSVKFLKYSNEAFNLALIERNSNENSEIAYWKDKYLSLETTNKDLMQKVYQSHDFGLPQIENATVKNGLELLQYQEIKVMPNEEYEKKKKKFQWMQSHCNQMEQKITDLNQNLQQEKEIKSCLLKKNIKLQADKKSREAHIKKIESENALLSSLNSYLKQNFQKAKQINMALSDKKQRFEAEKRSLEAKLIDFKSDMAKIRLAMNDLRNNLKKEKEKNKILLEKNQELESNEKTLENDLDEFKSSIATEMRSLITDMYSIMICQEKEISNLKNILIKEKVSSKSKLNKLQNEFEEYRKGNLIFLDTSDEVSEKAIPRIFAIDTYRKANLVVKNKHHPVYVEEKSHQNDVNLYVQKMTHSNKVDHSHVNKGDRRSLESSEVQTIPKKLNNEPATLSFQKHVETLVQEIRKRKRPLPADGEIHFPPKKAQRISFLNNIISSESVSGNDKNVENNKPE